MPTPMVAGNWKMNTNSQSSQALVNAIVKGASHYCESAQVLLFPPFPYLAQVQVQIKGKGFFLGAQNVSEHGNGAYTGEVSASMLRDVGVDYVLVGHSERRGLYGETDRVVAAKFALVQQANMTPILCVGETLIQREESITVAVVTQQIQAVIDACGVGALANAVVAYEPIWAIGTGLTASPQQAQDVHKAIRDYIAEHDAAIAQALTILYGGSVTPNTAGALFAEQDIDGGLVGGASLQAPSFIAIGQALPVAI